MARIRFLALLVCLVVSMLAPPQASAFDAGQAAMSCRNSPQFKAGNSARQCVDKGYQADSKSCEVWLLATNGNFISRIPYDCNQKCNTRADGQAGMINGTMYSGGVCDNGCKVQPNLDPGTNFSLRENGNPNAIPIRSGTWRATGDVCIPDDTPPKPESKDEYCHQSGAYQVCKSKDKTCISTVSGFRTCASDTANQKGHTATNNSRTEAASISAPNSGVNPPSNRPGEDWKPSGPGGSITNNNGNTTNNFNGYKNEGTPNGNTPTPGDGSGPGAGDSNGNGEQGEGNGNTATGGGNCASPPATGGDPILGMIAMQTWATRCAAEKANGGKVTGDVGNCEAPFSVEGDTVQANQLRAQRAQLCAGRPGEGQGSTGNPHEGAEDADGPGKWSWKFDESVIDKSGFGGGSCPQLGTLDFGRFGTVSLDGQTWWCPLIAAMRTVMLLLGMFISFRVVFGD
ncbi:hypothetical protein [Stenotrophomonas maltophilia]|uniref:hypothetical protein n=1 Tax=Stenotrophomonas maltophilia TaxID=40324 RepID=UPI0039C0BAC2